MRLDDVLELSPHLEVAVRNIYWRSEVAIDVYTKVKERLRGKRREKPPAPTTLRRLIDAVSGLGATTGDLLILHSGFGSLKGAKAKPADLVDSLLKLVGTDGTLAMPAIPRFDAAPQGIDRMKADISSLVLDYDPKNTPAWTGAVPNCLRTYPEAIRSRHPLNTMVALGPLAASMMERNTDGDRPLPCGRSSSWYFCYQNDARVVALGADMAHSLTMIHVAEDMNEETWSRRGWYRNRTFRLIENGNQRLFECRERHPRWAMHYAERTLSKDLLRTGIMKRATVDGVNIEVLSARALVDYLNSRNHTGYPYYWIPSPR